MRGEELEASDMGSVAMKKKRKSGLGITEEVGRVASESGFITCGVDEWCPITKNANMDSERRRRGPPGWVGFVLEGINEGRIVEEDFWGGNSFQI